MSHLKRLAPWAFTLLVAACHAPPERPVPSPLAPAQPGAPATTAVPSPAPAVPPAPAAPVPGTAAGGAITAPLLAPFPADVLYMCVKESGGQRQQTAIDYLPKVRELCRRHPEMGPCQYERDVCRQSGGRVFASDGTEVTMATEAEYDRKVMRVRFRSN